MYSRINLAAGTLIQRECEAYFLREFLPADYKRHMLWELGNVQHQCNISESTALKHHKWQRSTVLSVPRPHTFWHCTCPYYALDCANPEGTAPFLRCPIVCSLTVFVFGKCFNKEREQPRRLKRSHPDSHGMNVTDLLSEQPSKGWHAEHSSPGQNTTGMSFIFLVWRDECEGGFVTINLFTFSSGLRWSWAVILFV